MTTTLRPGSLRERIEPAVAVVTTDGGSHTWQNVFEDFAPAIESFARSRGVTNAEDVVQEVFATAVERFPEFEGDLSGLRSYLFTLAYRRVADEYRSKHRRGEQLVADHIPVPDANPGVEESVTHAESASEAMQALDVLGDRERQVIEMRIIHEASIAAVAEKLGISNGNVRVIQARALVKVRKHLAATTGSLRSGTLVFAFLQGLRSDQTRGGISDWISKLQSEPTREAATNAAAATGSALVAGTAATGTIAGAGLKVGLVLALATASSVAVGSDAITTDEPAEISVAQPDATRLPTSTNQASDVFVVPPPIVEEPAPESGSAGPDSGSQPTAVADPDQDLAETADEGMPGEPHSDNEPFSTGEGNTAPDDVVTSTVTDVAALVDTLVDDVVGVVDDVVGGVGAVVDTAVDDLLQPVVDDVVVPLVTDTAKAVDDTIGSVVEELDPVVDTVDSLVDDVTDGLGLGGNQLLGGLLR